MHWLETRIPPPVVMLLLGGVGCVIAQRLPLLSFALPLRISLAVAIASLGVGLNILPKLAFRRAATTVNPINPERATALVTSGIYWHTRNPMYLGHTLILLGWAVYLHNAAALLIVPGFMLYITRFQIQVEERVLAARFPDAYTAFCRQTRRWL